MGSRTGKEFSPNTKWEALIRQGGVCAGCGVEIDAPGVAAREKHRFGEVAEAHHIQACIRGGSNSQVNCVILCKACHYNAHEGGQFKPPNEKERKNTPEIVQLPSDFEFYFGKPD